MANFNMATVHPGLATVRPSLCPRRARRLVAGVAECLWGATQVALEEYLILRYKPEVKKCLVEIERFAEKQLRKLPLHIQDALDAWRRDVEMNGILEARKRPGYHDEPLKGERQGQRSVRLNRAYRAIYEQSDRGDLYIVAVVEVNKHEY